MARQRGARRGGTPAGPFSLESTISSKWQGMAERPVLRNRWQCARVLWRRKSPAWQDGRARRPALKAVKSALAFTRLANATPVTREDEEKVPKHRLLPGRQECLCHRLLRGVFAKWAPCRLNQAQNGAPDC